MRDRPAVAGVAATILIMAYASHFGAWPILVFYGIWFSHLYYKGQFTLRPSKDIAAPLILAALAVASTLWSDYPEVTAKAALEFTTIILCSIIAARVTSFESFLKGVALGTTLVLIATLIDGTYGGDPFTGTYSLVGLFGSKNEVGVFAEVGLYASLLYFFKRHSLPGKILYSIVPLIVCGTCLVLSRSATSAISLVAMIFVTYAVSLVARLSPRRRMPALLLLGFFALLAASIGLYLGEQDLVLRLVGKDTTLTGRTFLWAEGLRFGMKSPFLGTGFFAFWVPGRPEAENLWFAFQMYSRTGFHFHNLFMEAFVDLGFAGLLLITFIVATTGLQSLRALMANGTSFLAFYSLGMSLMFLVRAWAEVDAWGTFGLGCFLFYAIAPRLASQPAPARAAKPPAVSR